MKSFETNLGDTAAKFDDALASLAVSQCQYQQQQVQGSGMGDGDVVKRFYGSSGRGGLVTPPSPRSLNADSNKPTREEENEGEVYFSR